MSVHHLARLATEGWLSSTIQMLLFFGLYLATSAYIKWVVEEPLLSTMIQFLICQWIQNTSKLTL